VLTPTTARVPLVRCLLDGTEESMAARVRFVPLNEFELWRHLMEARHRRVVRVQSVSVWVAEDPSLWNSSVLTEELEPVLRVRLLRPGLLGVPTLVERFFPVETYPLARQALLRHLLGREPEPEVETTPGYFVPPGAQQGIVAA